MNLISITACESSYITPLGNRNDMYNTAVCENSSIFFNDDVTTFHGIINKVI